MRTQTHDTPHTEVKINYWKTTEGQALLTKTHAAFEEAVSEEEKKAVFERLFEHLETVSAPRDEVQVHLRDSDDDSLYRHLNGYLRLYMEKGLSTRGHDAQQLLRNCLHASAYLAYSAQMYMDAEGAALMKRVEEAVVAAHAHTDKAWHHLTDLTA